MHKDTSLSNLHKDHQMCYKMQRGAKGEVSHSLPSPTVPPSRLSPPLLSSRDMCTRCASRHFQLSATDAQTAAVSPFPSSLPALAISLPFTILPLFISSALSPSFPLLCHSARHFSSAGYKGRSCCRERACVIFGCTSTQSCCFSWRGNATEDLRTPIGPTQNTFQEEGEEEGIRLRK